MRDIPLNAMIAQALGWTVWEDPRTPGRWFQESPTKAMVVIDYVAILRDDLKMHTGNALEQYAVEKKA